MCGKGEGMKKNKKLASVSTLLGADTLIEGTVAFKDTLRVDGKVKGTLNGDNGVLIVGAKAEIDADIEVDRAVIMGRVNGTVTARERIEIYPPACIAGDVRAPVVTIDAGVVFNGRCAMSRKAGSAAETDGSS